MTIERAIEMPRLIDAEELELQFDVSDEDIIAKEIIRNAPTVDAVPVVRCRDCIEFEEIGKHPTNNGGTPFGHCYHWQYEQGMSPNEVDGDDFCSYGERKEEQNGRT